MDKFGVDIGYMQGGVLIWTVIAPTANLVPGSLAGSYGVLAGAQRSGSGLVTTYWSAVGQFSQRRDATGSAGKCPRIPEPARVVAACRFNGHNIGLAHDLVHCTLVHCIDHCSVHCRVDRPGDCNPVPGLLASMSHTRRRHTATDHSSWPHHHYSCRDSIRFSANSHPCDGIGLRAGHPKPGHLDRTLGTSLLADRIPGDIPVTEPGSTLLAHQERRRSSKSVST
jgi:Protein of unknown function (DUF992)